MLDFGLLTYLNCLPATLALEKGKVTSPDLKLRPGTPAELNELMSSRELDVSLVSAAEYLRNEEQYCVLEDISLWCDGAVKSVGLFSPYAASELQAGSGRIAVTPESATSVALTELLLPSYQLEVFSKAEFALQGLKNGEFQAVLLIGDQALQAELEWHRFHFHDLGQWWKDQTQLPMTYAVWVCRKGLSEEKKRQAKSLLSESLKWGQENRDRVLEVAVERSGLDKQEIESYLQGIQFNNTPASVAGLAEFRARLKRRRVLANLFGGEVQRELVRVTAL